MRRFEDFNIYGINYNGAKQQRAICPNCTHLRSPKNQKDRDLSVNLEDGVWHCHHCNWRGSLNINEPEFEIKEKIVTDANIYNWIESNRHISAEICEQYGIGFENNSIQFPYFENDKLVNIKYRNIKEKKFYQSKGGKRILYGINDIQDNEELFIVEGEFDKLAFAESGIFNCVSIPDGAINPDAKNTDTKLEFLKTSAKYLKNVKTFILALDNDSSGIAMRDELARRLGKEKCKFIEFGDCKDANEYLIRHGKTKLFELAQYTLNFPLDNVIYVHDTIDGLEDFIKNGLPKTALTKYPTFDKHLRFPFGQVTTILGIPTHGKSTFLDNIASRLIRNHNWKFAIWTPENNPVWFHLRRMMEIETGKSLLKSEFVVKNNMSVIDKDEREFLSRYFSRYMFYIDTPLGNRTIESILQTTDNLIMQQGINALIVDPYAKLIKQDLSNETKFVEHFMSKVVEFAQKRDIHIFLVTHPTKMPKKEDGRYIVPSLYNAAGSANFFNLTDNGFIVYRDENVTTVHVEKVKQNIYGQVGNIDFKFLPYCQRFIENSNPNDIDNGSLF